MPISASRTVGGGLSALFVVLAARRARALAPSGALAAWVVGTTTVVGGGWVAGGALVAFFASSSILSRAGRRQGPVAQQRGNERDAVQVAANGGFATLAALAMVRDGPSGAARAAFYGSLAAAAADTWATELGRCSAAPPRRVLLGPPVPAGASGGMTPLGTAGSVVGATAIAAIGALEPGRPDAARPRAFAVTLVAGVCGALADSVLGATVQAVRVCPACGLATERAVHCGVKTNLGHGWGWLDNDAVNAAATGVGALTGWGLDRIWRPRPARRTRSS